MNKLDIKSPNHLVFKHDKLCFEVLGGINPENYHSLRVMLVTAFGRIKHRDNVDLLNYDQTTNYTRKAAEVIQIHPSKIKDSLDELIDELEDYKLDLQNQKNKPASRGHRLSDEEKSQAVATLQQPKLVSVINGLMDQAGIVGNETNRIILFLTYLTRKTNASLHSVVQSPYNYLQSKLGELIPEEEKVTLSHISDNALFYFGEIELQNKVILVEDTVSNRKRLLPLIGFQMGGTVTRTTVTKNEFAELITVQKHLKGNASVSISTREEQAFNQNGALSFVLHEETGTEQDEKILMYQRKQSAGLVCRYNELKVIKQIQNLQRALTPITVINPYAMELHLPEQIRNKQITNLHYLRFVEVITFLKQHQRTIKTNQDTGEQYIETSLEDIREANLLLAEILVNKSDVLNKPTRLYLEQLKDLLVSKKLSSQSFTLHEISIALLIPKATLVRYNRTLVETGLVKATGEGNKKEGYLYQLADTDEYKQLKKDVHTAMSINLSSLEKRTTTEPKTIVNQIESDALNQLETKVISEVSHKAERAGSTKITNERKKAA